MKKVLVAVALAAVATAALGVVLGVRWLQSFERLPALRGDEPVVFEVARGASAHAVYATLRDEGLIADDPAWPLWLRLRRPDGCLKAGSHRLPPGATPPEIFAALCRHGSAQTVRVTLVEGLTMWQVADTLADAGLGERARYLELFAEPTRFEGLDPRATSLEGYLFPDTYEFYADASEAEVLGRLVARHREVARAVGFGAELPEHARALDLEAYDLLVLASMVEREAAVAEERPRIAQVFFNRLREGMRLQSDPTCVYGEASYRDVPSPRHCRDRASRYSTYVIDGLPPTPIASPGRASLQAVLAPSAETELRYFCAMHDGTGRHAFAATLQEHNRNVDRYLRR